MVGIYCRISGDKIDGKDTSIETQEMQGIAFAASMGMDYKIYIDRGISGKAEIESRIKFREFLKDIKDGRITHIYAINQSRIERNPDTWRIFVSTVLLAEAKWYPNGSYFDLDNTTNRLMANMMSVMNEFHSDNTSDNVKLAFESNAKKGKGHGIRAYGIKYDDDGFMVKDEAEIEVVKDIFEWSLSGMGAYTIANKLNLDEVPTRFEKLGKSTTTKEQNTGKLIKHSNKKWWGSTVHGILTKKLYCGVHVWNGEEIELPDLAIISKEEFYKVQENLKKNKKESIGKNITYNYLLNGLMYCLDCGHMYKGVIKRKSRDNSYKCSGKMAPIHECKYSRGINIPRFETFILKHLFESKSLQEHLNKFDEDKDLLDILQAEKNAVNKKLSDAVKSETRSFNLLLDGDFADDERLKAKYKTDKEKVIKLKKLLAQAEEKIALQKNNYRLGIVNNVMNGFDFNGGFEASLKAVNTIIERIDIRYQKLEKNGVFSFVIKYKGFNETSIWTTNQQMTEFTLNGYYKASNEPISRPEVIVPTEFTDYISHSSSREFLNSLIDKYRSKDFPEDFENTTNLKFGVLDSIVINKEELVVFN
ncbi:recombinase family protein [Mangrovimonas sp. DI 80]|uniref:recombinase family protein n=1 Tax=Mangrovimonas sp. DI 80 TaxID=1779330 RepID=UPI000977299D|nr:recombinase family protein [Mangrovimonas sp. DI 80]OMP30650.1 hypothetical protein BKM32_10435 [Mangrovimonas sp. DI 80]